MDEKHVFTHLTTGLVGESYMVKVGKQETLKKYYQLNNMKNEIK